MGLFDWFSGPQIDDEDLAPPPERQLPARSSASAEPTPAAKPKPDPKLAAANARKLAGAPLEDDMPEFGVQKAIELMRELPDQQSETVVRAVCKTLESMGVKVPTIIEEAHQKQAKITGRIKGLRGEISELKEEIAAREEEIRALEEDHDETRRVRERLDAALKKPAAKTAQAGAKPAQPAARQQAGVPHPALGTTPSGNGKSKADKADKPEAGVPRTASTSENSPSTSGELKS